MILYYSNENGRATALHNHMDGPHKHGAGQQSQPKRVLTVVSVTDRQYQKSGCPPPVNVRKHRETSLTKRVHFVELLYIPTSAFFYLILQLKNLKCVCVCLYYVSMCVAQLNHWGKSTNSKKNWHFLKTK